MPFALPQADATDVDSEGGDVSGEGHETLPV